MILFPAIDLKDGQCVRLRQGVMSEATVFGNDPAAQALAFERLGFESVPTSGFTQSTNSMVWTRAGRQPPVSSIAIHLTIMAAEVRGGFTVAGIDNVGTPGAAFPALSA